MPPTVRTMSCVMILLPLLLILLMMHHNHIVHSEHCSEEVEFVTAVSDIVSESVLIVFNENSNKGETINREVDMIKYEIETVEEIIEKDLSSMEVNSDDEHSSAMSLSSAGVVRIFLTNVFKIFSMTQFLYRSSTSQYSVSHHHSSCRVSHPHHLHRPHVLLILETEEGSQRHQ